MRRSGFGLQLAVGSQQLLHPEAADLAREVGIPAWLFLAGPHGEFELVYSVPPGSLPCFRTAAAAVGLASLELGIARAEPGLQLSNEDGGEWLDTAGIRNLAGETDLDVHQHVARYLERAYPKA